MNKERLIVTWDSLKGETQAKNIEIVVKEIKEDLFVPKMGETYYYYAYYYAVGEIYFKERNCSKCNFDIFNIEVGNCFQTPEEAILAGKCYYYTKRFETYVNRHSEKLDWENDDQAKYCAFYRFINKVIRFTRDYLFGLQGTTYASSEQILKDAIADIGEENFLKYVMKVEK